ncbi:MAG: hypothetical protein U1E79_13325 [Ottowia sp.]|jgi:hypothetical protein|nr:hypothetical protein [Pseudomonadota bacterium]MCO5117874.1 hypothetical protein [Burkholderiaceae bacterium]
MQQAAVGGLHGDLADPALWVGGQRAGSGCGVEDTTVTAAREFAHMQPQLTARHAATLSLAPLAPIAIKFISIALLGMEIKIFTVYKFTKRP